MTNPPCLDRAKQSGGGRWRDWASLVSIALSSVALLVPAPQVVAQTAPNARPTGGVVVAGSAVISQDPTVTTITQTSQNAVVSWRSFDVGSQQRVHFQQPNPDAITLIRVTGPDLSQITGRIDANGQVVLTNRSGVTFFEGAQVNVSGVIVSSANINNPNFMAGRLVFDGSGGPNAEVANNGTITIKGARLAVLVAPRVANAGVLTAQLGDVVLAGAATVTVNPFAAGMQAVDVSGEVTQAPVGADGKPVTALVSNTGTIDAAGGTVALTAVAADGIVHTLIESGGKVNAASVGAATGTVAVFGVGGSIVVQGELSAEGAAIHEAGGDIQVIATSDVTVDKGVTINASGKAGGGVVAVGTTLARASGGPGATAPLAANATIASGATIKANATAAGAGGTVAVLSKGQTTMAGKIVARGGPQGGNGGSVELSGGALVHTGTINVSAPMGAPGTVLLGR